VATCRHGARRANFAEDPGAVVRREHLIEDVWDEHWWGPTKTLDVHIKRLRSRIEADPSTPVLITTVRGVGYRFAAAAGTPTA